MYNKQSLFLNGFCQVLVFALLGALGVLAVKKVFSVLAVNDFRSSEWM